MFEIRHSYKVIIGTTAVLFCLYYFNPDTEKKFILIDYFFKILVC